ncbi:MAG: hypothetical protein HY043_04530 [Verrucomicrobia bacterium]|nr:hypothetical protein [Verrucomicrobiota bacterium]
MKPKRTKESTDSQKATGFPFGLPFPKKVVHSLKNVPHDVGKEQPPAEWTRFRKKSLQNMGVDISDDLSQVFSPLRERFDERFKGGLVEDALKCAGEIYSAIIRGNPTFAATVPVVLERFDRSKPEVIGSAVLIRIVNRPFLLTAAHVTDYECEGALLIPGKHGFMQITGDFAAMRLPPSGRRADDKLDVAYFGLDDDCASNLHSDRAALERSDVLLEAEPVRRTAYTLAGYPWRKAQTVVGRIEADFCTLSGVEAKKSEYEAMGLSRSMHIAVRFHRRRTFHDRKRRVMTAPLPHGMSGGGVYVWNEEAMKKWPIRLPLVGIANEYIPERSLLIATRLHVYISCIFHNHHDLAAIAGG